MAPPTATVATVGLLTASVLAGGGTNVNDQELVPTLPAGSIARARSVRL
ncbi:MAG: hypothetical protein HOQ22_08475 [Nocardioidaceae bacterium]|nr:hypothetical protein [Nocardioidaceae bacterium]